MRDERLTKEMLTQQLTVHLFDRPDDAPKYQTNWTMLRIEKAMVVAKGTIAGKPTIDLQMIDADGKQYLVMATGAIMEMLVGTIKAACDRTTKEREP